MAATRCGVPPAAPAARNAAASATLGVPTAARTRADPATAGIHILLLSAGASSEDVARGLAAGADAYLAKPFGIAALVAQVRALSVGQPA